MSVARSSCTTLGLRCPSCGRLEFHQIWRFALGGGRKLDVECSCGATKAIAFRTGREVRLQIPCVICETTHDLVFTPRSFWSGALLPVRCAETGIELGHVGDEEEVRRCSQEEAETLQSLVASAESDGYFLNPPVMYGVLNHLHDIASNGKLYCRCGNPHLELNIYPDRLELHCPGCDGTSILFAEDERDLALVKETRAIEMSEGAFSVAHLTRGTRRLKARPDGDN